MDVKKRLAADALTMHLNMACAQADRLERLAFHLTDSAKQREIKEIADSLRKDVAKMLEKIRILADH